jgi:pantoate--beta-alanine ligase
MQRLSLQWKREGKVTALVPTMGALHAGHRALLRAARRRADKVVASLFVNPAQFGPSEDLAKYPRSFAADCALCRAEGADVVFAPDAAQMYPPGSSTWVIEEALSKPLCGAQRPGHFRGVCTVVAKLFMLCQPALAFFGMKDAQQALVIARMVRDLNMPVRIVACPTVRERDGLALSSRNAYLGAAERRHAPLIREAIAGAARRLGRGEGAAQVQRRLHAALAMIPGARVDYAAIVDADTLSPPSPRRTGGALLIAVAVFLGAARLIDNERVAYR